MAEAKTVNLHTISAFKHEGVHYAVGEVLHNCEAELAKELTGAGRTRKATDEEVAADKRAAKKQAAAA